MSGKKQFLSHLAETSEMFCSLKYEDVRGYPYNVFTPEGVVALSGSTVFLAMIALLMAV